MKLVVLVEGGHLLSCADSDRGQFELLVATMPDAKYLSVIIADNVWVRKDKIISFELLKDNDDKYD